MTIATRFFDYQHSSTAPVFPAHCSPALIALRRDLESRWGVTSLGCYGLRNVRGGTSISTHAFGAAIDLSYAAGPRESREQICGYLVAWSEEWGIQAIHDYLRSRIWRAGRTRNSADACSTWWRAQRPSSAGMGQLWAEWVHIEVYPDRWGDTRSAEERGIL